MVRTLSLIRTPVSRSVDAAPRATSGGLGGCGGPTPRSQDLPALIRLSSVHDLPGVLTLVRPLVRPLVTEPCSVGWSSMLTPDQRLSFDVRGYAVIPGALDPAVLAEVRGTISWPRR